MILALACAVIPGCAGQEPAELTADVPSSAISQDEALSAQPDNAGLTLTQITAAAVAAGDVVSDGHNWYL